MSSRQTKKKTPQHFYWTSFSVCWPGTTLYLCTPTNIVYHFCSCLILNRWCTVTRLCFNAPMPFLWRTVSFPLDTQPRGLSWPSPGPVGRSLRAATTSQSNAAGAPGQAVERVREVGSNGTHQQCHEYLYVGADEVFSVYFNNDKECDYYPFYSNSCFIRCSGDIKSSVQLISVRLEDVNVKIEGRNTK